MSSKTEIANMAISHLGIGKEIANLETEQSSEASACRRFYDSARKAVLGDIYWSFATKFATLNLIESSPNDEWDYSYRYPTDCLDFRRILSGMRQDTANSRIIYKLGQDTSGRLIYTDQENAEAEYTVNVEDPGLFTEEFILALSFRLASYIAPRITGGDPFKMKEEMLGQYEIELGKAKKKNLNEENLDRIPQSEFITTRS